MRIHLVAARHLSTAGCSKVRLATPRQRTFGRGPFIVLTVLLSLTSLRAQVGTTASRSAEFDAVSIKLQRDSAVSPHGNITPGGLRFTKISTKRLIQFAYPYRSDRIIGGPGWLDTPEYDIVARTNQAGASKSAIDEMIRTLLANRFGLRVHTETRQEPVYALVVARSDGQLGPSIRRSTGCDSDRVAPPVTTGPITRRTCGIRSFYEQAGTSVDAGAMPIAELVRALDGTGGRKVVDKTGLEGLFDFILRFAPPRAPGATSELGDLPEVTTAIEEQLGLKFRSEPGSVDVLVIDAVQRPLAD